MRKQFVCTDAGIQQKLGNNKNFVFEHIVKVHLQGASTAKQG